MTLDSARYALVLAPTHSYYVDEALNPIVDANRLYALFLEVNGIYIVDHDNERAQEDPSYTDQVAHTGWEASVITLLSRLASRSFGLVEIIFERGRLLRRPRWVQTVPLRCSWEGIGCLPNYEPDPFFWTTVKQERPERIESDRLEELLPPSNLDWWATYGIEEDFLMIQPNVLAPGDLCRIIEQCTGFEVRQSSEKFLSHADRVTSTRRRPSTPK